jgi:hypothetical protein
MWQFSVDVHTALSKEQNEHFSNPNDNITRRWYRANPRAKTKKYLSLWYVRTTRKFVYDVAISIIINVGKNISDFRQYSEETPHWLKLISSLFSIARGILTDWWVTPCCIFSVAGKIPTDWPGWVYYQHNTFTKRRSVNFKLYLDGIHTGHLLSKVWLKKITQAIKDCYQ